MVVDPGILMRLEDSCFFRVQGDASSPVCLTWDFPEFDAWAQSLGTGE